VVEQIERSSREHTYSTKIGDRLHYGFDCCPSTTSPLISWSSPEHRKVSRCEAGEQAQIPIVPAAPDRPCGGAVPLKGGMVIDLTG
jgi:hypothetical protein